jgi:hypothetical protein
MSSSRRPAFQAIGFLSSFLLLAIGGCGPQSPEQAMDKSMKEANAPKAPVYPLAGRVTIDGAPAKFDNSAVKLVIMLNDPKKADKPLIQRPYEVADPEGNFAFHTYTKGDGVPPGDYVLTFAVLTNSRKSGLHGPDKLKNRYNDPDKNAENPEFKIDVKSPGKSDYHFDLKLAGEEEAKPGPKALTELLFEKMH